MRPYIICHMIASVDGRIDCAMVDKISGDEYYTALEQLNCPSNLMGRVTMEHYHAKASENAKGRPAGKPSYNMAVKAEAYAVAVDTRGELEWPEDTVDGLPLLCIVSEQASEAYLESLRTKGISWIACGKNAIDLPQAMNVLAETFGVQRLAVLGGGHINAGFLQAGLIDELSLMIAPGVDGRAGQTALFDGLPMAKTPTQLHLFHTQAMENGTVWLRYKVDYQNDK